MMMGKLRGQGVCSRLAGRGKSELVVACFGVHVLDAHTHAHTHTYTHIHTYIFMGEWLYTHTHTHTHTYI
jgi:hypothetical protein